MYECFVVLSAIKTGVKLNGATAELYVSSKHSLPLQQKLHKYTLTRTQLSAHYAFKS